MKRSDNFSSSVDDIRINCASTGVPMFTDEACGTDPES